MRRAMSVEILPGRTDTLIRSIVLLGSLKITITHFYPAKVIGDVLSLQGCVGSSWQQLGQMTVLCVDGRALEWRRALHVADESSAQR